MKTNKLYKKIFDAQVKHTGTIIQNSNEFQREIRRIYKLWDKTETMRFTLFSKKEILQLLDEAIYDFNYNVKKSTSLLLDDVNTILKDETPGSETDATGVL